MRPAHRVDKYLLVVMMLLIGGMIIGITQVPPRLELFYGGLAGAIIVIGYSTYKNRKERQAERRARRRSRR